jgi:hypothetical protein
MTPPSSTRNSSQKTVRTFTDESGASSSAKQADGDDVSQEPNPSVQSREISHLACRNGPCSRGDKEHHSQCRKNPDSPWHGPYYRFPRFLEDPPAEDSNKLAAEVREYISGGFRDSDKAWALRNRINAVVEHSGGRGGDYALLGLLDELQEVINEILKL